MLDDDEFVICVTGPQGTRLQRISPTGTVLWQADASQPGGYTQNTTLSPGQQQLYDQTVGAQNQALGIAGDQIGRVGDALGQGFDLSNQPALQYGVQGGPMQTQLNQTPGQQYGFDQGQGVQGQVAGAGQIGTGFNSGGAIQGGINGAGGIQNAVGNGGQIQTGFDNGGQVQTGLGGTQLQQGLGLLLHGQPYQSKSR